MNLYEVEYVTKAGRECRSSVVAADMGQAEELTTKTLIEEFGATLHAVMKPYLVLENIPLEQQPEVKRLDTN